MDFGVGFSWLGGILEGKLFLKNKIKNVNSTFPQVYCNYFIPFPRHLMCKCVFIGWLWLFQLFHKTFNYYL
jgi:hypothetical protein